MRLALLSILAVPLAFGCGASDDKPEERVEGTVAEDCRDNADNDADGLFDCDDDGCEGSPDCAEETSTESEGSCESELTVTGTLSVGGSVIGINERRGEGLNLELTHKIDIDTQEAGCIEFDALEVSQQGLGCNISMSLSPTTDGRFLLSSLVFTADSYCPDFLDDQEGIYHLIDTPSLEVTGLPGQIAMETGTEERICLADLEFEINTAGSLVFEDGTQHGFFLGLQFAGDIWTEGSTDADCVVTS